MPSLFDSADLNSVSGRISRLTPGSQAQWGKMNCAQMMWHCAGPFQQAVGDKTVTANGPAILRFPLMRWLILNVFPVPKGAPTAPEYIAPDNVDFAKAKADLTAALDKFTRSKGEFRDNPVFGRLSREDWGKLMYKHMDHHLRQFGV
ncbi:MAG: DUF1569 domain-containing protein [Acidobacteria bacterium]|nr:DUF1569 domain-containing protein [Acidobacteriota bacterium]